MDVRQIIGFDVSMAIVIMMDDYYELLQLIVFGSMAGRAMPRAVVPRDPHVRQKREPTRNKPHNAHK